MQLPAKKIAGVLLAMIAIVVITAISSAGAREAAPTQKSEQARGEAEARIARTDFGGRIEAALGDEFAGIWFDPSTAQVHVNVTSPGSRELVEAVSARAGVSDLVAEPTIVASTWSQLKAAQKGLNEGLRDLLAHGEVRTWLDPERNSVAVEVGSGVSSSRLGLLRWQVATLGVDVSIATASQPDFIYEAQAGCKKFEQDKAHCDRPIVAGVTIEDENGDPCTAGPAAILTDRSTAEKATTTFLLTAGHCIKEAGGVGRKWYAYNKAGEKTLIGFAEEGLQNEKGEAGDLVDVGFISVDNTGDWVHKGANAATPVTPRIAVWDPTKEVEPFAITAAVEPMVNMKVCVSGQSTGKSCGPVVKLGVTQKFENEAGEIWTAEETVEVEDGKLAEGDSGAPWFVEGEPNKVLGTHIGSGKGFANFQSLAVSFANLKTQMRLLTTKNEKRAHPGPITGAPIETLPKGTKVTVLSTNAKTLTNFGTITCAKTAATGELIENLGETAKWSGSEGVEVSTCQVSSKTVTVTDFTAVLRWLPASVHKLELTFVADMPGGITCHFSGNVPFTYVTGSSVITIKSGDLVGTPAGACEPGLFSGDFTLQQTAGGVVVID